MGRCAGRGRAAGAGWQLRCPPRGRVTASPVGSSEHFSLLLRGQSGLLRVRLREVVAGFQLLLQKDFKQQRNRGGSEVRQQRAWQDPATEGLEAIAGRCCCHPGERPERRGDSTLARVKENLPESLKKGHPHLSAFLSVESAWKYSRAGSKHCFCLPVLLPVLR